MGSNDCLPSFTGFPWLEMAITWFWTELYWVFTGFRCTELDSSGVLPGCYRVLPGSYWNALELGFTGFYWVLLGFVALNSTRVASYRVFTEFYRVFLGSELERLVTEFLPSFYWVFYSRRIAWVNLTGFLFDFQRPCSEGTWLRQLLPAATSTIFFFSRSIDHFFFCRSISCVDFLIGRTTALIGGTKKNTQRIQFGTRRFHFAKWSL